MNRPIATEVAKASTKGFKSLLAFWTKVNNDWVMNFASGLAFNLLATLIPLAIAIFSLTGFIYGRLVPSVQTNLIHSIQKAFPSPIPSEEIVRLALDALNKQAGLLGIIAIVFAVIASSGLFITMEGIFGIIYHTRTRGMIQQYMIAIGMILLFVVLTPLLIFADTLPALVQSILQETPISQVPWYGFLVDLVGILVDTALCWVLFEVMYVVVPHRHISFRKSWFGALLAALAIQVYLPLFPFYVTHFLGNYTGTLGLAIIFLVFLYYATLILLIGAEINAFFGEGIPATTDNLAGIVRDSMTIPPS